ncbi:unnamed protein product [Didymodactylos carnosus]|uniref:Uncharacterized protein n=1 Tax=Didymodactylos carnosus TaxID=1234261 RepID=A0A8S2D642_9BILA|nr:unnamed protein product [Didymodactylos carnosus]CAF3670347.1 unnamed protein product [Didymodactylos carnosus]
MGKAIISGGVGGAMQNVGKGQSQGGNIGMGLANGFMNAGFQAVGTAISNAQLERSVDLSNRQRMETTNQSIKNQQSSLRATPHQPNVPPYLTSQVYIYYEFYVMLARLEDKQMVYKDYAANGYYLDGYKKLSEIATRKKFFALQINPSEVEIEYLSELLLKFKAPIDTQLTNTTVITLPIALNGSNVNISGKVTSSPIPWAARTLVNIAALAIAGIGFGAGLGAGAMVAAVEGAFLGYGSKFEANGHINTVGKLYQYAGGYVPTANLNTRIDASANGIGSLNLGVITDLELNISLSANPTNLTVRNSNRPLISLLKLRAYAYISNSQTNELTIEIALANANVVGSIGLDFDSAINFFSDYTMVTGAIYNIMFENFNNIALSITSTPTATVLNRNKAYDVYGNISYNPPESEYTLNASYEAGNPVNSKTPLPIAIAASLTKFGSIISVTNAMVQQLKVGTQTSNSLSITLNPPLQPNYIAELTINYLGKTYTTQFNVNLNLIPEERVI